MNALLVRVGADQSEGGGFFNGIVDNRTGSFLYVPIPETREIHSGFSKPYSLVSSAFSPFSTSLPRHLNDAYMHLDPDFEHLTYGDQGKRAEQIKTKLGQGDLLVFYAGLKDTLLPPRLTYAIIGLFVIEEIVNANSIPVNRRDENAHTRRVLMTEAEDIVVRAKPKVSGRLQRCLSIGSYRTPNDYPKKRPCYRVESSLLTAWGGLNTTDGYIQRSARLPEFLDASKFYTWFLSQEPALIQRNN